jgi:integrase
MSRHAKGPRLYLARPRWRDGKLHQRFTWFIRDGNDKISTRITAIDRAAAECQRPLAEQKLAEHIGRKYQINRERGRYPSEILVLDVLNIYLADAARSHARPEETKQRVLTLAEFFASDTLAHINGQRCREYATWRSKQVRKACKPEQTNRPALRVTAAAARRELEDLRAAINHHRREGLCSEIVSVVLPEKSRGRDVWLMRSQAARLIWAAWRARQIMQDGVTKRAVGKHIARFILVGLYTGSRSGAICGAALMPTIGRGHVDLERGVFYRRAAGAHETKKRQPPARLPDRLLTHLRRWQRLGIATEAFVEWNGKPVYSVRKGFAAAALAAGLPISGPDRVTPHVLRHTAATWAMQNGADLWQAAGFLGMTVEMLQARYGHHHPDFQADAARAVAARFPRQFPARMGVNKTRQTS